MEVNNRIQAQEAISAEPQKRVRIWLDSSWLLNVILKSIPRLEDDLLKLIATIKKHGYQPEIAITKTILTEVTGITDTHLLQAGFLEHDFFNYRNHSSKMLNRQLSSVRPLARLLGRISDGIKSLPPEGTESDSQPSVIFVDTKNCHKNDLALATILQEKADGFDLDSLKRVAKMKAKYSKLHMEVPPEQLPMVEAWAECVRIEDYLSNHPKNGGIFSFCAFQADPEVKEERRNSHLEDIDDLFLNPIFQITAHNWLGSHYPYPKHRGEFSIQSGVKSSDCPFQVILSCDAIDQNKNFLKWKNAIRNTTVALVHPENIASMMRALDEGDFHDVDVWKRPDLVNFCQCMNDPAYLPAKPLWAVRSFNNPDSPSTLVAM